MKKAAFIALIVGAMPYHNNAQGFIMQWMGGYGWQPGSTQPIPAQLFNSQTPAIDAWTNLANVNVQTNSSKTFDNSYGHGFNINMLVGYMFNPYIGVALGINYQQSKSFTASLTNNLYLPDSTGAPQLSGGYITSSVTTQSRNLTLSPSLILTYDKPGHKVYPYLRAGLTLPVFTIIDQQTNMTLAGAGAYVDSPYYLGAQTSVNMETYGRFAVGFNGALGFGYRAYPFLHLFVEMNAQYLNMKANYSLVTEWTGDGIDYNYNGPGGRDEYRILFQYVKTLNANSNNAAYNPNYNSSAAKQELSPNFPFSYLGFNLGVQLTLNKKIFKDQDLFEEERAKKQAVKAKKKKAAESKNGTAEPTTPSTTSPSAPK